MAHYKMQQPHVCKRILQICISFGDFVVRVVVAWSPATCPLAPLPSVTQRAFEPERLWLGYQTSDFIH
jgi:hypothetical protein